MHVSMVLLKFRSNKQEDEKKCRSRASKRKRSLHARWNTQDGGKLFRWDSRDLDEMCTGRMDLEKRVYLNVCTICERTKMRRRMCKWPWNRANLSLTFKASESHGNI